MKFALFYEIPVPKPFTREKEHRAYKNVRDTYGIEEIIARAKVEIERIKEQRR